MPDIKKFLDSEGLKVLWQKISLGDYPNNDTLVTVINAIDENKQDKITGTEKQVAGFDINGKLIAKDLDETLTQIGVPADAKATGDTIAEVKDIADNVASAFDISPTTTNTIEWDGVVGDRLTVQTTVEDGDSTLDITYVHVSDYAPDAALLTEQGFTVSGSQNGAIFEEQVAAEEATGMINTYGNDSGYDVSDMVIVALEDNFVISSDDKPVTFPKKGIYFFLGNDSIPISVLSLSSPLLAAPSTKVQLKESALPETMFETAEKPFELAWYGEGGELIEISDGLGLMRVSDYAPQSNVFTDKGFSLTLIDPNDGSEEYYNVPAEEATNWIRLNSSNQGYDFIKDENPIGLGWFTSAIIEGDMVAPPGFYVFHFGQPATYFKLSSPLMTQPATQIKESALPDSIKKPADWKQDDPTQLDYIANRPFYDEWDSVIFDSSRFVGNEGISFNFVEDLNIAVAQFPETDFSANFSRIVPNKTYTIAIGDYVYTGTSFEVSGEDLIGVGIGNMSLLGSELPEGIPTGDTNANLLAAYGPDGNGTNLITLMTSEITESGNHWVAIVEGDSLKKTIAKEEGESTIFGVKISDKYITEDDLKRGFELKFIGGVYGDITYTQDDVYEWAADANTSNFYKYLSIEKTPYLFTDLPDDALVLCYYESVRCEVLISLKEDIELTLYLTGSKIVVPKGTYLTYHIENSAIPVEFTLNHSTAFTPCIPVKKIDKKYLPDQIQSSWKQNDSEQSDFIKDRPFYDGWSSVVFDSHKIIEGMDINLPFESPMEGVIVCELNLNEIDLPITFDYSRIVPGKTYTLAIGDKTYTSQAFDAVMDGVKCIGIGNGALYGDVGIGCGDPNAQFLIGHISAINYTVIMALDDAGAGNYWVAIVEGDSIGDTVIAEDWDNGYIHVSDNYLTEDDLKNGYTIVCKSKYQNNEIIFTETNSYINNNVPLIGNGISIGGIPPTQGYGADFIWSLPQDSLYNGILLKKGTYFVQDEGGYIAISFKINNSTVFAPSTPTKQLDEKYIPNTIARVADIEKQVQTNYLQGDPRAIDFIKNRPFHDEWDSFMFEGTDDSADSKTFVKQDGFNGVFYEVFTIWPMMTAIDPKLQLKVGNTYTFIINNKVYSGIATEYFYNGFNRIIIGNSNLLLPGSNIGDTSANFVVHYVNNLAGDDPGNFSIFYIDDITEAGEYPIVAYNAKFRDSLNWDDGEYHTVLLDDVVFFEDAFFTADDLIDGFTITIVRSDGTVFTFTEEDATLGEEDGLLRIWVNEKKRLALTCYNKGIPKNNHFKGLHGRCGVVLTNYVDVGSPFGKVTSFKPNNPLVLMPKYPAKKIDKRFLPDDIGGGLTQSDIDELMNLLQ